MPFRICKTRCQLTGKKMTQTELHRDMLSGDQVNLAGKWIDNDLISVISRPTLKQWEMETEI